jgi:hypothetical protein
MLMCISQIALNENYYTIKGVEGTIFLVCDPAQVVEMRAQLLGGLGTGVPAITERDRATISGRAVVADPQRRMRLLHRLGGQAHILNAIKLTLKTGLVLEPERFEHLQHFIRPVAAFLKRDAEGSKFFAPPPHADPADEATIGEGINGGEHLGHHHWIAVPENKHGGANPRSLGTHRGGGQHGHRFKVRGMGGVWKPPAGIVAVADGWEHHMITHPERGDTVLLGVLAKRGQGVPGGDGTRGGQVTANLHLFSPLFPVSARLAWRESDLDTWMNTQPIIPTGLTLEWQDVAFEAHTSDPPAMTIDPASNLRYNHPETGWRETRGKRH